MSFEQDIGILGLKITSFEAVANIAANTSHEFSHTVERESSVTYETNGGQDSVVIVSSPLDMYYYRYYEDNDAYATAYPQAIKSDPSTWGIMAVSLPSSPQTLVFPVERYNEFAEKYGMDIIDGNFWMHTSGDPGTYPTTVNQFKNASNILSSDSSISATSGSGSVSTELTITESTEDAYTVSLTMGACAGAGGGGFIMGVTFENTQGFGGAKANFKGKGYIYEFMESDILEKDRMNYYINAESEIQEKRYEIKKIIVTELIDRAKMLRRKYPDMDARVYHCCFSDNREEIEFYKTIEGFKHDEGMYILSCDLGQINSENINNLENVTNLKYKVLEDNLNTEKQIQSFIIEHSKVFRGHPYSIDKILKLKEKEGFKSITIYDEEKIIGNILLLVEEESGQRFGWLEDMFVCKGYRNKGLGEFLVISGLHYFKSIGIHESRLELWSANIRATNLYYKVGYRLLKETESSIGMAI